MSVTCRYIGDGECNLSYVRKWVLHNYRAFKNHTEIMKRKGFYPSIVHINICARGFEEFERIPFLVL
jgi:hypothetical protein